MKNPEIDPMVEDEYWRDHYASRPYAKAGKPYAAYRAAYRMGWEGANRYGELNWERAETRLRDDWTRDRGESALSWEEARDAVRDAWQRIRPGADYKQENR